MRSVLLEMGLCLVGTWLRSLIRASIGSVPPLPVFVKYSIEEIDMCLVGAVLSLHPSWKTETKFHEVCACPTYTVC